MRQYTPSEREHDFAWMLRHSEDLEQKAKRQFDTSKLIYCCLELRNCLERLEFFLLLGSVDNSAHKELSELAKPYHGNEKVNKTLKSLTYKTQIFYETFCKVSGIKGVFFDYKKSSYYKSELSQYIHTYTRLPEEMKFKSVFIQNAFPLIDEVRKFLYKSLLADGKNLTVQNIDYGQLPNEEKALLKEWREDKIDEDELKQRMAINIEFRKRNSKQSD